MNKMIKPTKLINHHIKGKKKQIWNCNQYPPARKKSPPTFKITNLQSQKKRNRVFWRIFWMIMLLTTYLQPFLNSETTNFFSIFFRIQNSELVPVNVMSKINSVKSRHLTNFNRILWHLLCKKELYQKT